MALTEYHAGAAGPSNVIDLAARRAPRTPIDPTPTTPAPAAAASVIQLHARRPAELLSVAARRRWAA